MSATLAHVWKSLQRLQLWCFRVLQHRRLFAIVERSWRAKPWGKCICPWTAWCWLPRCSPRAHTLTSGISEDLSAKPAQWKKSGEKGRNRNYNDIWWEANIWMHCGYAWQQSNLVFFLYSAFFKSPPCLLLLSMLDRVNCSYTTLNILTTPSVIIIMALTRADKWCLWHWPFYVPTLVR